MTTGSDTLDAVQNALVSAAVGQETSPVTDWFIYRGLLQDAEPGSTIIAARALCLNETPGKPPLEAWLVDYPGVQIVGRGNADDFTALRQKMQDVFYGLHNQEASIGSDFVYFLGVQSAPLLMGFDERRRPKMAWNFRIMRKRPS